MQAVVALTILFCAAVRPNWCRATCAAACCRCTSRGPLTGVPTTSRGEAGALHHGAVPAARRRRSCSSTSAVLTGRRLPGDLARDRPTSDTGWSAPGAATRCCWGRSPAGRGAGRAARGGGRGHRGRRSSSPPRCRRPRWALASSRATDDELAAHLWRSARRCSAGLVRPMVTSTAPAQWLLQALSGVGPWSDSLRRAVTARPGRHRRASARARYRKVAVASDRRGRVRADHGSYRRSAARAGAGSRRPPWTARVSRGTATWSRSTTSRMTMAPGVTGLLGPNGAGQVHRCCT